MNGSASSPTRLAETPVSTSVRRIPILQRAGAWQATWSRRIIPPQYAGCYSSKQRLRKSREGPEWIGSSNRIRMAAVKLDDSARCACWIRCLLLAADGAGFFPKCLWSAFFVWSAEHRAGERSGNLQQPISATISDAKLFPLFPLLIRRPAITRSPPSPLIFVRQRAQIDWTFLPICHRKNVPDQSRTR